MKEIGYTSFLHYIPNFEHSSYNYFWDTAQFLLFLVCFALAFASETSFSQPFRISFNIVCYSRKKTGELRIYFFENPSGIFEFFSLPLEISDKTRLYPQPRNSTKLCYIPWNLSWSMSSINSWKIHLLFLFNAPGNSVSSTPYYSA